MCRRGRKCNGLRMSSLNLFVNTFLTCTVTSHFERAEKQIMKQIMKLKNDLKTKSRGWLDG